MCRRFLFNVMTRLIDVALGVIIVLVALALLLAVEVFGDDT